MSENPTQAAPPAAPAVVVQEPDDDRITMSKDALSARLSRATRSAFKAEFGTEDAAEIKAKLEQFARYEAEREEARKASLTREQQLAEEVAREKAAREKAEQEAASARFEAQTSRLFAETGIKNHGYATFRLQSAMAQHGSATKFDERAFLESLLQSPGERAALGMETPAAQQPVAPPSTSPSSGNAPPPPPAGAPRQPKTAWDMSASEWLEFKSRNGL